MRKLIAIVIVIATALAVSAAASASPTRSSGTLNTKIARHVAPLYPPIADAGHH